jgi:hypothetical protein
VNILATTERNFLEKTIVQARKAAEEAAHKALEFLAIQDDSTPSSFSSQELKLRRQLRAVHRHFGDYETLVQTCAFEQWHRMFFARCLAENNLLLHPKYQVSITLQECEELALETGQNRWQLAAQYAGKMLPGIFQQDDPVLDLIFATEDQIKLEKMLNSLPDIVFTSDDGLGWSYQFWQKERKEDVQSSGLPVEGSDVSAYTQLFTENYMVRFLLQNTLGAWWLSLHPDSPLRDEWEYYKPNVQHDFSTWPTVPSEITLIDPCCGSGHFLIEAFNMLWKIRTEAGEPPAEAASGIIQDNLYGLELDARCVQIAAFALALAAWKAGFPANEKLPVPNIACCGLPLGATKEEWRKLANGDTNLSMMLTSLYDVFANAQELGSLISPKEIGTEDLFIYGKRELVKFNFDNLIKYLEKALSREKNVNDPVAGVFGSFAKGALRAYEILSGEYHLTITNPPFLLRGNQGEFLKDFCTKKFPEAKKDLATCFLERCKAFTCKGGYSALVNPQNWLFLTTDKPFRDALLQEVSFKIIARLGARAFETISGEVVQVALVAFINLEPTRATKFIGIEASEGEAKEKASLIKSNPGIEINQLGQLRNPDSRIVLGTLKPGMILKTWSNSLQGLISGDYPRFGRNFWELPHLTPEWNFQQSTVNNTIAYGGREHVVLWEQGKGVLSQSKQARVQGTEAWGKHGVAVSQMRELPVTLYTGELFDNNTAVIIPKNPENLPAIWAFCKSPEFNKSVRMLDQKLNVTNATLVKVPFDLARWQKEAEKMGPLPEPYSDDPTQWIFKGNIVGSEAPLHVAVARLLGYCWPEQENDNLASLVDPDGIVCIPPVLGERAAVDRLRDLLAGAYGQEWGPAKEAELLKQVNYENKGLEAWLKDSFFSQHTKLFHNRPFIWQIWDGRKDGFSALVNYHGLDRAKLEKLIFSYLGDWIARQNRELERPGAEAKLTAALELKQKLESILVGEEPYDIYVRWKKIEKQAIGWNPDLNDGVRLNIRPFVKAEVLRNKFSVSWKKDRGRDPDGSERINDLHLTIAEKEKAREARK